MALFRTSAPPRELSCSTSSRCGINVYDVSLCFPSWCCTGPAYHLTLSSLPPSLFMLLFPPWCYSTFKVLHLKVGINLNRPESSSGISCGSSSGCRSITKTIVTSSSSSRRNSSSSIAPLLAEEMTTIVVTVHSKKYTWFYRKTEEVFTHSHSGVRKISFFSGIG